MDIQQLYAMGAFVTAKPEKRTFKVEWPVTLPREEWSDIAVPEFTGEIREQDIDVWVKRMSAADDIAILKADEEDRLAVKVLRLTLKEDGTPQFDSLQKVKDAPGWLFWPLFQAVREASGDSPKGNSETTTPSGSKSPLPSEGEAPRNGKKR